MKKIGSCQSAQCDIDAEGVCQMKLRRFTSAGVEMARQYLAAVKESNGRIRESYGRLNW